MDFIFIESLKVEYFTKYALNQNHDFKIKGLKLKNSYDSKKCFIVL
jgi:hypothetical protein